MSKAGFYTFLFKGGRSQGIAPTVLLFCLFLVGCFNAPTAPEDSQKDIGIVIDEPTLTKTYRFYKDSLFTELVPLADGSYPGNSVVISDKSEHPKYKFEDIPDPAWVIRMDLQEGTVEEWKLVGDSLARDGESVVMDWVGVLDNITMDW